MFVNTVENGYLVYTLMPSLKCSLDCPHCYLSKVERSNPYVMPVEDLVRSCINIDSYYQEHNISHKIVRNYWYGGEPTEMGIGYFDKACSGINSVFTPSKGYDSTHTVLSSLVTIKDVAWLDIIREYCDGYIQTSFDGFMRGKGYVRNWEKKIRWLSENSIRTGTISVVNSELLEAGPEYILDYLSELGIVETSWLPFMLNLRNSETGMYDKYAPTMKAYSEFMIRLTKRYIERKALGLHVPEIGQMHFVISQAESHSPVNNIAGQTLFLMPDGTVSLPDYIDNTYKEYLKPFGNILTDSFEDILTSPSRRGYLRKQVLKNGNRECMGCSHADKCVMEFWKDNRENDDCFGARNYVEWVLANRNNVDSKNNVLY